MTSGSLWMGGLYSGNLHVAAMTYRSTGSDFFPGPLDPVKSGSDTISSKPYDSIWNIKKIDISNFRNGYFKPTKDMVTWPDKYIPNSRGWVFDSILAPFVDVNGDGKYTINTAIPMSSDYPAIKGDQALWWVFNDNSNSHGETHGLALGVEVHAMAYAFNCPLDTALNNTVFIEYKMINRSTNTYDSFYVGDWISFNSFSMDFVGTDTLLNCFYGYNSSSHDSMYGNNPPAQAVVFLDAPMTNSLYYNNDFNPVDGNPEGPMDYFSFLHSEWKNNTHLVDDGKGGFNRTDSGVLTNFIFPGYPDSPNTKGWTQGNSGIPHGDRRMLGSSGPYTFKGGETKTITFAYVFTQRPGGNNLSNLAQMRKDVAHIRSIYNAGITTSCSSTGIEEAKIPGEDFKVFPNPALDGFSVEIEKEGHYTIRLVNMLGQTIMSKNVEGSRKNDFSLQGVLAGVYSIILSSGNEVGVKKLIVK